MSNLFELWTILRVNPPPPSPLVLGKMEIDGNLLPRGVGIFTSFENAKRALTQTLLVGVQPAPAFTIVRIGMEPKQLSPQKYIGLVMSAFLYQTMGFGIEATNAAALLSMVFGVYVDPMTPKDAIGLPTQSSLYQFLGAYFPSEITSMEATDVKFYFYNGYQILVENFSGAWLVATKRGEFKSIESFRVHMAKMGEAFYGTFDTVEKAVEEVELWINGTQELAQILRPNEKG